MEPGLKHEGTEQVYHVIFLIDEAKYMLQSMPLRVPPSSSPRDGNFIGLCRHMHNENFYRGHFQKQIYLYLWHTKKREKKISFTIEHHRMVTYHGI
jgi:hypothetical protein